MAAKNPPTLREMYLDILSEAAKVKAVATAVGEPAGVVDGILRDPQAYFFWLISRSIGQDADDWEGVLTDSGIPAGYGPGVRPEPNGYYGLTQQIGGDGPRGRIFLPTAVPDSLGYYTRPVDVLEGEPPNLTWKWRELGGPPYAPVSEQGGGSGPGPIPPPSGGMTEQEVQAMIDKALIPTVKIGDKIALKSWGDDSRDRDGKFLCAEDGGPKQDEKKFDLTSRSSIGPWESWMVERGV